MKSTNIELSMLQQIEDHMKTHNISFAEFIRRAAASYLDHNPDVSIVNIIDDSKLDEIIEESIKDIPEDTEPPPKYTSDNLKSDFNFDDVSFKS